SVATRPAQSPEPAAKRNAAREKQQRVTLQPEPEPVPGRPPKQVDEAHPSVRVRRRVPLHSSRTRPRAPAPIAADSRPSSDLAQARLKPIVIPSSSCETPRWIHLFGILVAIASSSQFFNQQRSRPVKPRTNRTHGAPDHRCRFHITHLVQVAKHHDFAIVSRERENRVTH